jgi:hypothetical protein
VRCPKRGLVMSDDGLFEWTNLFAEHTGLPCTIWINVHGVVTTDPSTQEVASEHANAVSAWGNINRETLEAHWRGDIDSAELVERLRPLPAG